MYPGRLDDARGLHLRHARLVVRCVRIRLKSLLFSTKACGRLVRLSVIAGFAMLVGCFWHPYYGFTAFLQIDREMGSVMVPGLRDGPIYIQPEPGSYDGGYYVQIATTPDLKNPSLITAIDDAGYRARRILMGAAAWVLGGGEPVRIAHVYAWLNVVLWFVLATLLWRVFPLADWRATVAWGCMLFSMGVIISVRLALTDLVALILTCLAVLLLERGRLLAASAMIGLTGLSRETGILGAAAFLSRWPVNTGARMKLMFQLVICVLPLGLWLLYVNHALGGTSPGQGNLNWPFVGWLGRWVELAQGGEAISNPRMRLESLLEHIALTVQLVYLLLRPSTKSPWWWSAAAYGFLLVIMGSGVWGGQPNAASRVLLPMTLAFNVLVIRNRAALAWLLAGNMSVFAGYHSMETLPAYVAHELPAQNSWTSWQMLEVDDRWAVAEWNWKRRWAWCERDGGMTLWVWPQDRPRRLELEMRGVTPRDLRVSHQGLVVWQGLIGERPEWITLPALSPVGGKIILELHSNTAPFSEGDGPHDRRISFACFGIREREP